jgi:hypothetical protein
VEHFWKCPKRGNLFNDIDGIPVIQKKSGKPSATKERKGSRRLMSMIVGTENEK